MSGKRMKVRPRFVYRDLDGGKPVSARLPFPLAGVEPALGGVQLDRRYVYDAELLVRPFSDPAAPPRLYRVHDGWADTPRPLLLMEGEPVHVFLDAWHATPGATPLHVDGKPWTHPGPPEPKYWATLTLGSSFPDDPSLPDPVRTPLVPIACTRFAWWRRLEVLLETLHAMLERYEAFSEDATRVSTLANKVHAFFAAMGDSNVRTYEDPKIRDGIAAAGTLVARTGRLLDGRLDARARLFLQRYSNVCFLVYDLLCQPGFLAAAGAYSDDLPDPARNLVVTAAILMDAVPPGFESESAGATVGEAPNYCTRFLARFFVPWIEEALRKAKKPIPAALDTIVPPASGGPDAAKNWKGVGKVARRSMFALVSPMLKRSADVKGLLGLGPEIYAGLEEIFEWKRDTLALGWARDMRIATEKAALAAVKAAEGAPAAVVDALKHEAKYLMTGVTKDIGSWREAPRPPGNALGAEDVLGIEEAWKRIKTVEAIDAMVPHVTKADDLARFAEMKKATRFNTPPWLWCLQAADIAWSSVLVYSAISEMAARGDWADGHRWKDLSSAAGNFLKSAGELAKDFGGSWVTREAIALSKLGAGLSLISAGADFYFFSEEMKELDARERRYLGSDRAWLAAAHCFVGIGKAIYMAGAGASLGTGPVGAILAGIGMGLDYAGQIMGHAWAHGADARATYAELLLQLRVALASLRLRHTHLGSSACEDGEMKPLGALSGYGGFHTIHPDSAARFGLVPTGAHP